MPKSTGALTPETAAEEALTYFRTHADGANAAKLQRYFKDPVDCYGVEYSRFKEWKADFHSRIGAAWTLSDAIAFCELLLEDEHMEPRGTGFQAVAIFVDDAGPDLLAQVRRWLEHYCNNWGLVDNLAPAVLSPLLRRHPELVPEVVEWTTSPNQWLRRASAVAFVGLIQETRFHDPAYEVAMRLQDEREDLVQKAVGWLLREAGKVNRDRLEAYLLAQGPKTPRTTLRTAIEKFSREDRERLRDATR